jgi:hypothetical protein
MLPFQGGTLSFNKLVRDVVAGPVIIWAFSLHLRENDRVVFLLEKIGWLVFQTMFLFSQSLAYVFFNAG